MIGLIHVNKSTEGDLMNRVMASRAIGAVCRAVLFCGNYKPIEDTAKDSPFAAPEGPKRARFVLGQIKNNLQAKVMKSIEYHIEGMIVGYDNEAEKDIEGSFLVLDTEHPENVEDIILEQEKRAKATKTAGGKAEKWLVGYLTRQRRDPGWTSPPRRQKADLSRNAIYRAKDKLQPKLRVQRVAQIQGGSTWSLRPRQGVGRIGTNGTNGDEWDDS